MMMNSGSEADRRRGDNGAGSQAGVRAGRENSRKAAHVSAGDRAGSRSGGTPVGPSVSNKTGAKPTAKQPGQKQPSQKQPRQERPSQERARKRAPVSKGPDAKQPRLMWKIRIWRFAKQAFTKWTDLYAAIAQRILDKPAGQQRAVKHAGTSKPHRMKDATKAKPRIDEKKRTSEVVTNSTATKENQTALKSATVHSTAEKPATDTEVAQKSAAVAPARKVSKQDEPSGAHRVSGEPDAAPVKAPGAGATPDSPRRWGTPDYERLGAVNRDPLDLRRADGTRISRFAKGGLYNPDGTRDNADILAREGIQFQGMVFSGLAERALRAKINTREAGDPIDAPGLPSENELLDRALAHHAKLAVDAAMAKIEARKAEEEEAREYAYVNQPPKPAPTQTSGTGMKEPGGKTGAGEPDRQMPTSGADAEPILRIEGEDAYIAALDELTFIGPVRSHLSPPLCRRTQTLIEAARAQIKLREAAYVPEEAEMEPWDNYDPDPDAHTLRRCRDLIHRYRRLTGITPDDQDDIDLDAVEFVHWVLVDAKQKCASVQKDVLDALWNGMDHYIRHNLRAARVMMNASRIEFSEKAEHTAYMGRTDRAAAAAEWSPEGSGDFAHPDRHLPWDDFDSIMTELERRSSVGAARTRLWLQASFAVGLRPIEWLYTDIHSFEMEGRKRDFLVVMNAKLSVYPRSSVSRAIDITELEPFWRKPMDDMVKHGRTWDEPAEFIKEYRLVKTTLVRIQKKIWGEVRYSLYSCRRQFIANQKTMLNPVELAAVTGHCDTTSQASGYPGAQYAWAARRIGVVYPNPDEVFHLRSHEIAKKDRGRVRLGKPRLPGNFEMKQIQPFLDAIERETPRPDTSPLKGIALG
ncbi:hypothetical protein FHS78_001838 [Parvibaculum indicum]|uniref:hypothetical protein n=1 Tax=Parvibaculum indicum TaxID=562969 RepID=UPI0014206F0B|nr:hypothetical protein [Parvibaculum indicum]NIJ41548.1 hypothetical protein [Parvibaculum indicum]